MKSTTKKCILCFMIIAIIVLLLYYAFIEYKYVSPSNNVLPGTFEGFNQGNRRRNQRVFPLRRQNIATWQKGQFGNKPHTKIKSPHTSADNSPYSTNPGGVGGSSSGGAGQMDTNNDFEDYDDEPDMVPQQGPPTVLEPPPAPAPRYYDDNLQDQRYLDNMEANNGLTGNFSDMSGMGDQIGLRSNADGLMSAFFEANGPSNGAKVNPQTIYTGADGK